MNQSKHLNIVLMLVIIVILILLIITNTLYKNKFSGNLTKHNNIKLIEGFTEPKEYHIPTNFELYKIDKENNKMHFTFNAPKPNIISNQVKEYILVIASYINIPNTEDGGNSNSLLEVIKHQKNINLLKPTNINLLKQNKLVFTINKLQEIYTDDNGNDKPIFYKFGLMAKYPNVESNIINVNNIPLYYDLKNSGKNFDYVENNMLNSNQSQQISLSSDVEDLTENNQDSTIEQLKDSLGGFPNHLNIAEFNQTDLYKMLNENTENLNDMNFNLHLNVDK